jgi:hypothetical protein
LVRNIHKSERKMAGSCGEAGLRDETKTEGNSESNSESHQRLQYAVGNMTKIGGTLQRTVLYCVCA